MMSRIPPLILALCGLSGCATLTSGTLQPIAIEARAPGEVPIEATCDLRNDKGTWQVRAPGTITITRSPADLHVSCEADGRPGTVVLVSQANTAFWGNALLTCGIGMPIDYLSGAGFGYPTPVAVVIGADTRLDKSNVDSTTHAPPR